ncbi:MAG: hypothetical protein ACI9TH_001313 [Kiritimatiellia bacterium]|jgi:hypothetical protein
MPFTLAHPAAILPLLKPFGRWLDVRALIIGSIAPDLSYFILPDMAHEWTHSWLGLIGFCLPAGLAAYALYRYLLEDFTIRHFPQRFRARLSCIQGTRWRLVPASILLGSFTHILWDSLTHPGPLMDKLPALQRSYGSIGGYDILGYKILQHGSTLLGVLVLAAVILCWYRQAPAQYDHVPTLSRTILVTGFTLPLLTAIYFAGNLGTGPWLLELQHAVGRGMHPAGTAVLLVWLGLALFEANFKRGKEV